MFENTKKSHFDKSLLQMQKNGDFKIEKLVENTKIRKFKCDILGDFQTLWNIATTNFCPLKNNLSGNTV